MTKPTSLPLFFLVLLSIVLFGCSVDESNGDPSIIDDSDFTAFFKAFDLLQNESDSVAQLEIIQEKNYKYV